MDLLFRQKKQQLRVEVVFLAIALMRNTLKTCALRKPCSVINAALFHSPPSVNGAQTIAEGCFVCMWCAPAWAHNSACKILCSDLIKCVFGGDQGATPPHAHCGRGSPCITIDWTRCWVILKIVMHFIPQEQTIIIMRSKGRITDNL